VTKLLDARWKLADRSLYDALVARYSEPHRHYHTLQHLEECFAALDEIVHLGEHPADVELALWFHDAIYDPRRSDNEERSAEWARSVGGEQVAQLVMVTRHEAVPVSRNEKVLVDVDLWILGAPEKRFEEYELQVREEYAWVPRPIYRRKRREILEGFLARRAIYSTEPFIQRYEPRARANLARSLARL
jgi:predicted metal-dependent HD superfamily phosphohydrolase